MLASPFILDQRLADLRASDDDQRIARWRREANQAITPRIEPARRAPLPVRAGQPSRLAIR